jgi:phage terminase Nu1 subunit (DNA packaging protein)
MTTCTSQELAIELGLTVSRLSQLKTAGRFDGCFSVKRNRVMWDKEKAVETYNSANPLVPVSKTKRKKSSDLQIPHINESRAKSEHFRAELARIDLEVKEEELVEADLVKRQAFTSARTVRDALGNIPDRVSNQFAAETDPVVIHEALTTEIRKALESLTYA